MKKIDIICNTSPIIGLISIDYIYYGIYLEAL